MLSVSSHVFPRKWRDLSVKKAWCFSEETLLYIFQWVVTFKGLDPEPRTAGFPRNATGEDLRGNRAFRASRIAH